MKKNYFNDVEIECNSENYFTFSMYRGVLTINMYVIGIYENIPALFFEVNIPMLTKAEQEIPEIWCRENSGCLYGPHYDSTLYEIWDYYNGIFDYIFEHNHKFWNKVKVFVN